MPVKTKAPNTPAQLTGKDSDVLTEALSWSSSISRRDGKHFNIKLWKFPGARPKSKAVSLHLITCASDWQRKQMVENVAFALVNRQEILPRLVLVVSKILGYLWNETSIANKSSSNLTTKIINTLEILILNGILDHKMTSWDYFKKI